MAVMAVMAVVRATRPSREGDGVAVDHRPGCGGRGRAVGADALAFQDHQAQRPSASSGRYRDLACVEGRSGGLRVDGGELDGGVFEGHPAEVIIVDQAVPALQRGGDARRQRACGVPGRAGEADRQRIARRDPQFAVGQGAHQVGEDGRGGDLGSGDGIRLVADQGEPDEGQACIAGVQIQVAEPAAGRVLVRIGLRSARFELRGEADDRDREGARRCGEGELAGLPLRVGEHLRGGGEDRRGTVDGVAAHQGDPGVPYGLRIAPRRFAENDTEQFAVSGREPGTVQVHPDSATAPLVDDGTGRPADVLQGERGHAVQQPWRHGGLAARHRVLLRLPLYGQQVPAGCGELRWEVVGELAAGHRVVAHRPVLGVAEFMLRGGGRVRVGLVVLIALGVGGVRRRSRGVRFPLVLGRLGIEGQDAVLEEGGFGARDAVLPRRPRRQQSEHRGGHLASVAAREAGVRHLGPLGDQVDPVRSALVQRDGAD